MEAAAGPRRWWTRGRGGDASPAAPVAGELARLRLVQCVGARQHGGATVRVLKFSPEGLFVASGGADGSLVLWRVLQAVKEDFEQCEPQVRCESTGVSPPGPRLLQSEPWRVYKGHSMAVTALSWSRSQFLLSASEDRTVRLWHVQRPGCLVVFKHPAPVSSVDFSPGSDTVFASGAEATLRLWSVPDKRAVQWHSVRRSITALCFSRDGAMVIVGLDDGEIQFHTCDQHGIKFFTQIECRNRRGVQRRGKKVTGIETCRGRLRDMVLVSTNDSRVRLCSVDTFLCVAKFKGATNSSSPVAAACCEYSDHVLCGSEDRNVYLWKRTPELEGSLVDSKKKSILGNVVKKCAAQESFLAHGSAVTAALFAPARTAKIARNTDNNTQLGGAFILTGGADGHVHVFENQMDL